MLKNATKLDGPWHEVTIHRNVRVRLPMTLEAATAWADRLFPDRAEKRVYKTNADINPQDYRFLSQIILNAIRDAHSCHMIAIRDAFTNMRRVDMTHTMDRIHDLSRRNVETSRAQVRRHCADARAYRSIIRTLTAEWQALQTMLDDDVAALENWANSYMIDETTGE